MVDLSFKAWYLKLEYMHRGSMKVLSDLIDRSKKDISDSYDMIFKFQIQSLNASMVLLLPNKNSSMLALSLPYNA